MFQFFNWLKSEFGWVQEWVLSVGNQVIELPLYLAAPMMVLVGALDSSLLSLPEVNDYITVARVAHHPYEVYYFPLFPAVGSVVGCLLLYRIVRTGEQAITKRFHPKQLDRVKELYRKWGMLALVIPALLPPPMPFKIFVAAAGALGYPVKRFALVILIARAVRYYFWGVLAYFWQDEVKRMLDWLGEHFFLVSGAAVGAIILFILGRLAVVRMRNRALRDGAQASYSD